MVIDGPVSNWSNGVITSVQGSKLVYDSSQIKKGILQVNGVQLKRYSNNKVDGGSRGREESGGVEWDRVSH